MVCKCTFAVETFLNGESVYATEKDFQAHYTLGWNDAVPEKKSILLRDRNTA